MSISEKRLSTTGRRMKYCRKIEKLKLSELADKIDVPIFILKSYETDKKQLPYELARRIANVLHTTAGYLLGWEADPLLDPLLSNIYRQKTNEEALNYPDDLYLLGAYDTSKGKIWIITNRISEKAGDNATTVCFPDER